jgi:hypothetical protein
MLQHKRPIFRGAATALITPFRNGEIDFPALRRELLLRADGDGERARALLYKHGFSGID